MRSAIDGFSPGPRRQMPHPVSQVVQIKPPILALRKPVDEAEWSAWWRQVNLDATREARPVPSILIAGEKRVYGLSSRSSLERVSSPIRLELPVALLRSSCQARSSKATAANPRLRDKTTPRRRRA